MTCSDPGMTVSSSTAAQVADLVESVRRADSALGLLQATQALAATAHPDGAACLVEILGFNNPGAAVAAVDGLVAIGTPAVETILTNIDGYNYGARAWAVRALAGIGDVRGLEVLEDFKAPNIANARQGTDRPSPSSVVVAIDVGEDRLDRRGPDRHQAIHGRHGGTGVVETQDLHQAGRSIGMGGGREGLGGLEKPQGAVSPANGLDEVGHLSSRGAGNSHARVRAGHPWPPGPPPWRRPTAKARRPLGSPPNRAGRSA